MKQKTREELVAEIAKLEKMNEHYSTQDKRLREEFAKSFRWGSPKQTYGYSGKEEWDWKIPTWEQVFVEIGKLKSLMDYRDFEGNMSEHEVAIEQMKQNWEKYFSERRPNNH